MPEAPIRVFEIACKGCGRHLLTVERLRDPGIGVLLDHFGACAASEALGDTPTLGEIVGRARVALVAGA